MASQPISWPATLSPALKYKRCCGKDAPPLLHAA
jgi:hypothetical protein